MFHCLTAWPNWPYPTLNKRSSKTVALSKGIVFDRLLRGQEDILRLFYHWYRTQLIWYRTHINTAAKGFVVVADARRHRSFSRPFQRFMRDPPTVAFPTPQDRNVNMMPFIVGAKKSLPAELWGYWQMIEACNPGEDEVGLPVISA